MHSQCFAKINEHFTSLKNKTLNDLGLSPYSSIALGMFEPVVHACATITNVVSTLITQNFRLTKAVVI